MTDSSCVKITHDHAGDSAFHKRIRRYVSGRVRRYYAITAPGCEDLCRQELIGLGFDRNSLSADAGGVTFTGRLVDCQRANLHLRTATRILMRIDAFVATNERQLQKKSAQIPWELLLPSGSLPDINVSSRRSRLYHSQAITKGLLDGIILRLNGSSGSTPGSIPQTVFARLVEDRMTLSLDSSGDPLYKRGLKEGPARAPIRETLAAAILMSAGYDCRRPLVDPLCGAGTFSLEAAMMTKQMAPGVKRAFAFMGWPAFREEQWSYLRREAQSVLTDVDQPLIFASDIDADACERLAGILAGNGLSDAVRVAQKDFFHCEGSQTGSRPGLVAINPPYGIRIGSAGQADELFNAIGRHLARCFKGWTVALIAPRPDLARRLPFRYSCRPLVHGGLKLTLIVATIP
jgi:putative N6-adenine-specific DNA methylase